MRDDVESAADGDDVFGKGYGDVWEVSLGHEGATDVVSAKGADQCAYDADDGSAKEAAAGGYRECRSAKCAHDDAGGEAEGRCTCGCPGELIRD